MGACSIRLSVSRLPDVACGSAIPIWCTHGYVLRRPLWSNKFELFGCHLVEPRDRIAGANVPQHSEGFLAAWQWRPHGPDRRRDPLEQRCGPVCHSRKLGHAPRAIAAAAQPHVDSLARVASSSRAEQVAADAVRTLTLGPRRRCIADGELLCAQRHLRRTLERKQLPSPSVAAAASAAPRAQALPVPETVI
eukprot:4185243-Prymnesium_polylepis.2